MSFIEIEDVAKRYGVKAAVDGAGFSMEEGEFVSLLGPSGCGKTTLLRMLTGLTRPDRGRIALNGIRVYDHGSGVDVPTERRDLGMVFQSYALWPHMRVEENIGYPLRVRGAPRTEREARVREVMRLVDIEELAGRFPHELSGGQQQRVSVCRALVSRPKLLLMDEPLSNLDAKLRERLRFEIKNIQKTTGVTILYVTHDQAEALSLSDRIGVMREGKILQLDRPDEIYARPQDEFVADFVGDGNIAQAVVEGDRTLRLQGTGKEGSLRFELPTGAVPGTAVSLIVRPEDIEVFGRPEPGTPNVLPATLRQILYKGREKEALLSCGGLWFRAFLDAESRAAAGDSVWIRLVRAHILLRRGGACS